MMAIRIPTNRQLPRNAVASGYCGGFTLMELMVSMVMGSIIIIAAISLHRFSLANHHAVTYRSQLQEESFFISHVLKQQIAQVGYRPIIESKLDGRAMPIDDRQTAFPEVPNEWVEGQTIKFAGTTFSYRFFGASATDATADSSIFDCLGNPLSYSDVQQNQISLQDNQLVCTTESDQGVILGAGEKVLVEDIAYEIGIDDDGDRIVDRSMDVLAASDIDFVNSIRLTIKLLLATPDRVASDSQTYYFNGAELTAADRKVRHESSISLALRN